MTLKDIIENEYNTDSNGQTIKIGNEINRYSVDVTKNGDFITFVEYDNNVWAVEDDLQGEWTNFTTAVDIYLEEYIEQMEEEQRFEQKMEFERIYNDVMGVKEVNSIVKDILSEMETDIKKSDDYIKIMNVVDSHRLVSKRESELTEMGYNVTTYSMGSGGVGNVIERQSHYYIQIGYGSGKYNTASVVKLNK